MTHYKHQTTNGSQVHDSGTYKSMIQKVSDASVEAFIVLDDDCDILYANPATETMFGYSDDQLLNISIRTILPTVDESIFCSGFLTKMTTGRQADGMTFPVEMVIIETGTDTDHYSLAIIHDMSAHDGKKASVKLSPRQMQVLKLVVQGRTSREIADELIISIKTVETHRANIMNKLGVRNVSSLVRYAVENSMI